MTQLLELADAMDSRFLYDLRTHPTVVTIFPNKTPFSFEEHSIWFNALLTDADRVQFIARDVQGLGSMSVGSLRADRRKVWHATQKIENSCEFSYIVSPEFRSRGIGTWMVEEAIEKISLAWPTVQWVVSTIRFDNTASIRAMERAGKRLLYRVSDEEGVWAWQRR